MTKGDDPLARRRFVEHILTGSEGMRRLSDSLLKLPASGGLGESQNGRGKPHPAWA